MKICCYKGVLQQLMYFQYSVYLLSTKSSSFITIFFCLLLTRESHVLSFFFYFYYYTNILRPWSKSSRCEQRKNKFRGNVLPLVLPVAETPQSHVLLCGRYYVQQTHRKTITSCIVPAPYKRQEFLTGISLCWHLVHLLLPQSTFSILRSGVDRLLFSHRAIRFHCVGYGVILNQPPIR